MNVDFDMYYMIETSFHSALKFPNKMVNLLGLEGYLVSFEYLFVSKKNF